MATVTQTYSTADSQILRLKATREKTVEALLEDMTASNLLSRAQEDSLSEWKAAFSHQDNLDLETEEGREQVSLSLAYLIIRVIRSDNFNEEFLQFEDVARRE